MSPPLNKRVYSNCWYSPLNEQVQQDLYKYSQSHNYPEFVKYLVDKYPKISKPSKTAYYAFIKRKNNEQAINDISANILYCLSIAGDIAGDKPNLKQLAEALALMSVSFAVHDNNDKLALLYSQLSSHISKIYVDHKKAELAEKQVAIQEQKLNEIAKARGALEQAQLTPEQIQDRIKQIFSISP